MYASGIPISQPAAASADRADSSLGKDDFVKLLMAQLGNQDPTSPMDSQAFVAQLAQFANLEQLQGIGSRLDSLLIAQTSSNQTATASLVGRELVYRTDSVHLDGVSGANVMAELSAPASTVTVTVTDSTGKTVRTIRLGAAEKGSFTYGWDGLDDSGVPLPAGDYKVRIAAADEKGKSVSVEQRGRAIASGVSFANGYPELIVAGRRIKLSDVVEIHS
ncbi:flagellar hook assembly protein FlgD [Vulgatibacter incomptus]|uniref:Basal-body rod modification protein FlgD n=1 Tax=Vulgatibacter incomptus TaxID=1391653 RepID=A0A0K1PHN3_9BACT|nr:FlgD immunoglobulin-like domain containing protein [Vulgatibacter incomptus]AKU93022.1 Flagellar basal-body rod modification protein FlgD [Vulgatibacter incomptus]